MPFDYEQLRRELTWDVAKRELGYREGDPLNIAYICVDRHVEAGLGDRLALIHEGHEGEIRQFTFRDLQQLTNGWAHFLRGNVFIRPLDRVCLFLDKSPELYIGFLGILKTGAVVEPLFSAFGEDALVARMLDSRATAIITQRRHLGKVRKARERLPDLKTIIVIDHDEDGKKLREGEVGYRMMDHREDASPSRRRMPRARACCTTRAARPARRRARCTCTAASSRSTSRRRSCSTSRTHDVYWCTADPGWVTGTSYGIIGPWSLGATQVVLDAGFSSDRWYETIEKHRVTVWYTAPTAIRMLMKDGVEPVKRRNLTSLRHMCSVGEPLNPEAVRWGHEAFGLWFHDTFWQTETGSIVVTNLPGMPVKPGSMGRPFPALDRHGRRAEDRHAHHRDRARRPDRGEAAVAQPDAHLLEQHRRPTTASS